MDTNSFVAFARAHGDAREDTYQQLAFHFCEAYRHAPYGLAIEVGTRRGGSALMQLKLLAELYPAAIRPMLITIDPYGGKPYLIGGNQAVTGLYGDSEYLYAKQLLAPFSQHVHFSITSLDFLTFCRAGLRVWNRGIEVRPMDGLTHVYLDGDHDARTILGEVQGFLPMLKFGGRITIDNTPDDPATIPGLEQVVSTFNFGFKLTLLRPLEDMAVIVRG